MCKYTWQTSFLVFMYKIKHTGFKYAVIKAASFITEKSDFSGTPLEVQVKSTTSSSLYLAPDLHVKHTSVS